jgi:RimJ/RimL family protein N-acetyltransferase
MRINPNLQLGAFEPGDKANLLLYMNDLELYANTSRVPHPYTETDADNWLALTKKEVEEHGHPINWALRSDELGVIGGIGAFLLDGPNSHRDEIGYWLAAPFRGQGLMTSTVDLFCQYLFEHRPSLQRIEAKAFAHNAASARVLEKAGFEREGFAKKLILKNGVCHDALLFARFRPES